MAEVAPENDDNAVDPLRVENIAISSSSHDVADAAAESKVNATITINKPPMIANRVSTLDLFDDDGDLFPSIDNTAIGAGSSSDSKPNSIGDGDRQATFGSIDLASIMGGELDISSSSIQAGESGVVGSTSTRKSEDDVRTEAV